MRSSPLLATALCAASAAAEEGTRGAARLGGSAMPQVLEAVAGLAVVLALIFALAWAVRRFAHLPAAGKGLIRVLGGVALGSRERAVVVSTSPCQMRWRSCHSVSAIWRWNSNIRATMWG